MTKFSIKNFKLILAGAAMMGVVSACEVTELTPANLIPDQEAFATAARIESAVLGVYEAAQRGYYNGSVTNGRGYPFGAANVEQGDMRGEDMYNDQAFYEITYNNSYTPQSANNNGMWISLYRLINRANIVLENIDPAVVGGVLTAEEGNAYKGEMLFMRALAHHELLIHFARPYSDDPATAGVPYRTFAINDVPKVPDGEAVRRGTVAEGYTQLLADLDAAATALGSGKGTVSRVSYGAVVALKTRVLLHKEDWAGVLAEYEKIKSLYAVTPNPATPFRGGTSSDNIFSFLNSEASNGTVNGALPSMYGNPANGGRGLVKISPLIWKSEFWHAEDTRRVDLTSRNAAGIYSAKYIDPVTRTDPNVILRFSEVVLNAAEANAQLGNLDAAVTLLNSVRDRALPDTVPSFTAAGLGGQAGVLTAIYNERRIEFLAEGRRWADIHRLSGAGVMNGIPLKAQTRTVNNLDFYTTSRAVVTSHDLLYTDHRFIWPIPLDEIQNNTSAPIEQNPGY
ncbi:RagB/SusD family nutrient uptake outer membrane protein [Algoriphagus aestuariicola]|jgi:hypothetical protein|uniref:RagB/SusD family nutrient uptake outer membrane protein n=1 Tax=Algoriphagus aestuariicola TaxID=1852016 RepID=A0ABS3BSD8_9BACT|nr:RagB/SusD family nutrient uptake outer membrane protein [Algoriphagus aestuariicola]MBN7802228.1 RagB/SusD family nutrient uptake outer membrane protein [Algoriphagus aestuariicola]